MVARLLEKEQLALHAGTGNRAAPAAADGDAHMPVLRQLLLTASPRLCQSIRRVVRRTRAVLAAKAREQAIEGSDGQRAQPDKVISSGRWLLSGCPRSSIGSEFMLALLFAQAGMPGFMILHTDCFGAAVNRGGIRGGRAAGSACRPRSTATADRRLSRPVCDL